MLRPPTLVKLGTGLIGLVALALVAAILETSLDDDRGEGFAGELGGGGPGEPAGIGSLPLFLELLLVVAALIVAVLCAIYLLTHGREMLVTITGILVAIFVILAIVYVLAWFFGTDGAPSSTPPSPNESAADESGGENGGGLAVGPVVYGLTLVGTFFLVFVLSLLYTRSPTSADRGPQEPDPEIAGDTAADLSGAAERAADRLSSMDGPELEDEIRRAWLEMTRLLDVERPASRTPGEFADAAVDAGLDPDDVAELTALFEAVRYGRLETTPDREARAVEAFRRIADADEATHGNDEVSDRDR